MTTTQKILLEMSETPEITQRELAVLCGITEDGVKWQVQQLKQSGLIVREGGRRAGRWKLTEAGKALLSTY